ncbi:MAG: hypothetical protein ABJM53_08860 [Parasphingorhabdus sp.]|uniref:hypothetical protein n=1 Tax=Parasphingorhabdus sp. TaxID=2709688 RepID=UPI0032984DA1
MELLNIGQMLVRDERALAMDIARNIKEPKSIIHFIIAMSQIVGITQYFVLLHSVDHRYYLPNIGK